MPTETGALFPSRQRPGQVGNASPVCSQLACDSWGAPPWATLGGALHTHDAWDSRCQCPCDAHAPSSHLLPPAARVPGLSGWCLAAAASDLHLPPPPPSALWGSCVPSLDLRWGTPVCPILVVAGPLSLGGSSLSVELQVDGTVPRHLPEATGSPALPSQVPGPSLATSV